MNEGTGETHLIEVKPIVPTKTKIKVIVDLPAVAERAALSQSKGVGLCRLEGIIAASGKHPFYFVQQKNMKPNAKKMIVLATAGSQKEPITVSTLFAKKAIAQNLAGTP